MAQLFTITAFSAAGERIAPWFIEVSPGARDWPPLLFPFHMTGAGTEAGEHLVRRVARRALAAAQSYYAADDGAPFAPIVTLLGPTCAVVGQIAA